MSHCHTVKLMKFTKNNYNTGHIKLYLMRPTNAVILMGVKIAQLCTKTMSQATNVLLAGKHVSLLNLVDGQEQKASLTQPYDPCK